MDRVLKLVYDKWYNNVPMPNGIHPILFSKIKYELANQNLNSDNEVIMSAGNLMDVLGCPYRRHDNFYRHFETHFDRSQIVNSSQINNDDAIYLYPIEFKSSMRTLPSTYNIDNLSYSLIDTIEPSILAHIRSGKVKIVINHIHDPLSDKLQFGSLENYLENNGIDSSNTVVITGCGSTNHGRIKVSRGDLFLHEGAEKMSKFPIVGDLGYISDNVKPEDLNPSVLRNKKFLCFNRNLKEHRVVLLYLILKYNMLDDSILSFIHNLNVHEILSSLGKFCPDSVNDINYQDTVSKMAVITPYEIDTQHLVDENKKSFATNTNMKEFYLDSYFHIVPETSFGAAGTFLSEKMFRPIQNLQPFLLVGQPYSLNTLKEFGFKTFHPWIDESYDKEEDSQKRFWLIELELKKLAGTSIGKLHDMYYSMTNILVHNQNHLKTFLHYNPYSVFIESLDKFYPKGT